MMEEADANEAAQLHLHEEEHLRRFGGTQRHLHDPLSLPSRPITKLRTKRFKEILNGLIPHIGKMTNA
ncbi:hypothetical protein PanWU01x14_198670 [Parasponia andersonii]|uniref:Uncharacterized protein n=1 Tax=Parasponia andersonii TaxID=3476 RepID=A0A2P5BZ05_PARAD|nr:hypothetical protein PanWU01x14_198670 [Parasponia andersonii]